MPGNWTCQVTPSNSGGPGTSASATITMDTSKALSVGTSSISYGPLALGQNTGSNVYTTTITNEGNVMINAQLGGYGATSSDGFSMICPSGGIASTYETFSASTSTYSLQSPLGTVALPSTATINLQPVSSTTLYWGMGLPATGSAGTCQGNISFTPN